MRSGAGEKDPSVVDRARVARIKYETLRQELLTDKQREVQSFIQDLALAAKDKAHAEIQGEKDAAATPEEKAAVGQKQEEAYKTYFLEDLKSSLPAENWNAFENSMSY